MVVRHALWLGTVLGCAALWILLVAGLLSSHDPENGPAALYFVMAASPVWLPVLVGCSGLVGVVCGAVLRARRWAPWLAACCAALVLVAAMAWLGHWLYPRGISWPATGATWALTTGVGCALVACHGDEQTSALSAEGRRAAWWAIVTLESAIATWTGTAILGFQTIFLFDPTKPCTLGAGTNSSSGIAVSRLFPPQVWCVGADTTTARVPAWASAALVAVLTLAVVAASRVVRWRTSGPRRPLIARRWAMVSAAVVVVGAMCAAAVTSPEPTPAATARARQQTSSRAASSSRIATTPSSAPPALDRPVRTAEVREDLTTLEQLAQQVGEGSLLWPTPLTIAISACTTGGEDTDTRLTLSGMFTTRDLDSAKNNVDYNDIVQANIAAAKQIVDSWHDSGITGVPGSLHGQWYAGDAGHGTIDQAHVGFVDSVGQITVTGQCTAV